MSVLPVTIFKLTVLFLSELQLVCRGHLATSLLVRLLLGRNSLSASSGNFPPVECLTRAMNCSLTACIVIHNTIIHFIETRLQYNCDNNINADGLVNRLQVIW